MTLLSLVNAAQVLNVSGDTAYQGLWEYFVRLLLQHRVAPYFPDLVYSCEPCVRVGSGCEGGGSAGGSSGDCIGGEKRDKMSICACLVAYINALTAQQRAYVQNPTRTSLWSDIRAVRAFFKLVAQYVLCKGLGVEVEDLEDLEKACKNFRKKTTCMEVSPRITHLRHHSPTAISNVHCVCFVFYRWRTSSTARWLFAQCTWTNNLL